MRIINEKQQQKNTQFVQNTDTNTKTPGEINNYFRVITTTDTYFTQEEIKLLCKGFKYNLYYKQKNWLETLTLEAETAVSKIEVIEQQYYRHIVAETIKKLTKRII
jgi:hypothetical protein